MIITTFLAPAIFWPVFQIWWIKKGPEPKKLLKQKINFFMSINYTKEFLNSLHTGVVFSELFSTASNGRHYSRSWSFHLKISLCSVFQHAEFKFHGCSWIWDFRVCINTYVGTVRQKNIRTVAVFSCKMAFLKSKFKDDPVRVQRHTVPHFKDLE